MLNYQRVLSHITKGHFGTLFPITSAHLRLVRVRTNSHHTRRTGADRWQELNLNAKTAKRPWGYPDNWMVYFISNPKQKWIGCTPILGNVHMDFDMSRLSGVDVRYCLISL